MVGGHDLPDDIAPHVANVRLQGPKKASDLAFALHQQKKREKILERRSIKRLGNEEVEEMDVPTKLNVQMYRNETTSRLKEHYGMFVSTSVCVC